MAERVDDLARLWDCPGDEERQKLLASLILEYRERLRLQVELRLHPSLRRRIDPSDVIQETYLDASRKLTRYLRDSPMPFFLWLRRLTGDRLHEIHRFHLGAQARDARRDLPLEGAWSCAASSVAVARLAFRDRTSPSEAAARGERKAQVEEALERMDPLDREILTLRYFEQLTSAEAAQVLGIREEAARKRYLRALARFKAAFNRAS